MRHPAVYVYALFASLRCMNSIASEQECAVRVLFCYGLHFDSIYYTLSFGIFQFVIYLCVSRMQEQSECRPTNGPLDFDKSSMCDGFFRDVVVAMSEIVEHIKIYYNLYSLVSSGQIIYG